MEENIKRDRLDEVEKSEEYENLMNIKMKEKEKIKVK